MPAPNILLLFCWLTSAALAGLAIYLLVKGRLAGVAALVAASLPAGYVVATMHRDYLAIAAELRQRAGAVAPDINVIAHKTDWVYETLTSSLLQQILSQPKYKDPKRLATYEAEVFSQAGEDGIIQEIFRRIGTTNRYFVEFGAADGMENNSALLVVQGWKGLWMEGDPNNVRVAREYYKDKTTPGQLAIKEAFITAENIEPLFAEANVPPEPDMVSIDIDRNDIYVWQNIRKYRPRLYVVEYNGIYPPGVDWAIPYDAKAWWDMTSRAGASLSALVRVGKEKGYKLVGCSLSGVNAFFVRDDLVKNHFAAPYTAENHYEPPRHELIFRKVGFRPRRP